MPPDGELRHPIAELWSRPWAGMRPTVKPVPPEAHLPGTASSKRRRGAGGARGKRAHLGGSEGLADGLSGEPRTGAGFSPRREPGGAEEEDGPLSLPSWLCGPPETSQAGSDPLELACEIKEIADRDRNGAS